MLKAEILCKVVPSLTFAQRIALGSALKMPKRLSSLMIQDAKKAGFGNLGAELWATSQIICNYP